MATFSQTIIWTVLPNGVVAQPSPSKPKPAVVFSVLVSPRLVVTGMNDRALDLFPDFADWPARQPVNFKVQFGGGTPVVATRTSAAPDSKAWKALFEAPVAVRNYVFTRLDKNFIYSYPAIRIHEFIKQNYVDLSEFGSLSSVSKILNPKRFGMLVMPEVTINDKSSIQKPFTDLLAQFDKKIKNPAALVNFDIKEASPLSDFLKCILFHQPRTPKERKAPAPKVAPPDPDFHDMVAHLGEYPLLLRRLGLVIDFTAPAPTPGIHPVTLVPDFKPTLENKLGKITHQNVSPRTEYTSNASEFRALDDPNSDSSNGFLKLDEGTRFQALQIDTDGAGLKAFNFANNLDQASKKRRTTDTPQEAGLPGLRSSGIGIFKVNRAATFKEKMTRANAVNEAAENPQAAGPSYGISLKADDLTRGYRIDVRQSGLGNPWRSLCGRHEFYKFSPKNQPPIFVISPQVPPDSTNPPAEGFVTTTVVSRAENKTPGPIAIPEKPKNQPPKDQPPKDLYLQESLFRWEGWNLCVRRPGVPLASSPDEPQKLITTDGKGAQTVPPSDPPKGPKHFPLDVEFGVVKGSLPSLRFGRQYQLRARTVDLAGNSKLLDHPNDKAATPLLTYNRFEPVAAPAVLRGSPKRDGDSLEHVVIRTGNDLTGIQKEKEKNALRHLAPPPVAQSLAETYGVFDHLKPEDAYALISERDQPIVEDTGVQDPNQAKSEEVLEVFPAPGGKQHLYLPDPAVSGVLARFVPSGKIVQEGFMSFYDEKENEWPKFKPIRIEVLPAEKGAAVSHKYIPEKRTLQVSLPPSATARLQLSSQLTIADFRKMGVFNWIEEKFKNSKLDLQDIFRTGLSTVNPFRELIFVHAVQQPVEAPTITQLNSARTSLGQTTAVVSGLITVHGASTAKLDVLAEWDEYTGKGTKPDLPEIKHSSTHVGELPVQASDKQIDFRVAAGKDLKVDTIHHFGDTKHRVVTYRVRGTTSFREYFLRLAEEKAKENPLKPLLLTRDSAPFAALKIPNSARPPAPGVQYVMPTFRWLKQTNRKGDQVSSLRIGGGLRVYLDGPWYSSGAGELLGVILPTSIASERVKALTTQYGQDPIWNLGDSKLLLLPAFGLSGKQQLGLPLEEISNPVSEALVNEFVTAIGYEVKFDGERWYSDLQLYSPFYFPFVRLALARYQPESLPGAHLSRVVQADFIQLPPSRITVLKLNTTADLPPRKPERADLFQEILLTNAIETLKTVAQTTPLGTKDNTISVAVAGITHNSIESQNVVMVALQRATSPRKSELDWEPAPGSETVTLKFSTDNMPWGFGCWRGDLPLPAKFKSGSFRVVVTEMEQFISDVVGPTGLISHLLPLAPPKPAPARVVYVDTIEI